MDEKDRRLEIVVENDQLSLAIGKKGQNVRLASKLTGWKIDIKSQEEKKKEESEASARFEAFRTRILEDSDLGEKAVQALESGGITNLQKLKQIQSSADLALEGEAADKLYQEIQTVVNSAVKVD
jgi:N utilization substance protein A